MNPQISVIIPVYNSEKYISKSIDSIIRQSFVNWEMIIVNDGSNDGSGAICKEYVKKDKRITYYEQDNAGVSVARNFGMSKCKGDYILFLDSDDQYLEYTLEKLYEIAIATNADIVQCGMQFVTKDEDIQYVDCNKEFIELGSDEALKKFLTGRIIDLSVCTKLFRKESIKGIEFVPHRRMNEDKYFIFQSLVGVEKVTIYKEKLHCCFFRDGSVTHHQFSDRWFDNNYFAEEIYKTVYKTLPKCEKEARFQLIIAKYHLVRLMRKTNSIEKYWLEYKKYISDIKKIKIFDIKEFFSIKQMIGVLLIKHSLRVYNLMCALGIM